MDTAHVVMLLAGLALAALHTWLRLGRSRAARSWTRSVQGELMERAVLVVHPLLAAVLLLGAATGVVQGTGAVVAVSLPLLLCLVVLLAYLVLPLPVPDVVRPRWDRDDRAARRIRTDRRSTRA